jgi:hypothetical protein
MRDYPNMSYCMFENTMAAMKQCASGLEEALENGEPLELNQYEQRPFNNMYEMCRAMMELLEQHQEMAESQTQVEEVELD